MLGDIFNLHIPELYQSVVLNDFSQSQIIFPQEYSQPEFLTKDFQHEANVERVWTWEVSFKIEFEAIRFIKGFDTPIIVN